MLTCTLRVAYGTAVSVTQTAGRRMIRWLMNDELESHASEPQCSRGIISSLTFRRLMSTVVDVPHR